MLTFDCCDKVREVINGDGLGERRAAFYMEVTQVVINEESGLNVRY